MKNALKHLAAVLLGLVIVNAFCAWYYDTPPYAYSSDRATDTIRRPGSRVSRASEGMGMHRIDENGYTNPEGDGPIDVLMMGSSHTEGFNVAAGQDVTSRLSEKLGCRAYSLGMSAHSFAYNAANLERALDRFQPTRAVVLETDRMVFMRTQINESMADALPRLPATKLPLPDIIVDRPLAKRLYKQFKNLSQHSGDDEDDGEPTNYDEIPEALMLEYEDALTAWLTRLNDTAAAHGVRLVIWFHPHLVPDMRGNAVSQSPERCREAFANACARAGVTFVDLTEPFMRAYETEHVLCHGFANTCFGVGHLNAKGHEMAAEALAQVIGEGGGAP